MLQVEFNETDKTGLNEKRYVAQDRHGTLAFSLVSYGSYVRKTKRHGWTQVTGWDIASYKLAKMKKAGVLIVARPKLSTAVMAEVLRRAKDQIRWARDDV